MGQVRLGSSIEQALALIESAGLGGGWSEDFSTEMYFNFTSPEAQAFSELRVDRCTYVAEVVRGPVPRHFSAPP